MATLELWEQENYQSAKDNYIKFSRSIRRYVSAVYGALHSMYHLTLNNRLEAEANHKEMVLKTRFNSIVLHKLIRKACNGSIVVVAENVVGRMIECLHNYMLMRWEDYDTLPKYLEASEHKCKVLRETRCELAPESVRVSHINELMDREEIESGACKVLEGWNNATNDDR